MSGQYWNIGRRRRECYLMNLVGVCTSSMSPVVDVNDLVIRD